MFISLLALLLSAPSFAAPNPETVKSILESQNACGNFVRFDEENLYLGFGAYRRGFEEPRSPIPGKMRVAPLNGSAPLDLSTNDSAIDIATDAGHAFVLTYSSLEEWDLANQKRVATYDTFMLGRPTRYLEQAQGMARYQDKLIIAHGRLGLSIFNLKTRHLANQIPLLTKQLPFESMATGVTVQGKFAYILMDNFSLVPPDQGKAAFRGLIVFDLETEKVVAELDGIDPGGDAVVSDAKKLIVSFGGMPIWKYGLESLSGASLPEPEGHVMGFPVNGHPTGTPSLDDKYYYTCFLKAPAPGEQGGRYKNIPLALDRHALQLD